MDGIESQGHFYVVTRTYFLIYNTEKLGFLYLNFLYSFNPHFPDTIPALQNGELRESFIGSKLAKRANYLSKTGTKGGRSGIF